MTMAKKKGPRKTAVIKAKQRQAENAGRKMGTELLKEGILAAVDEKLGVFKSAVQSDINSFVSMLNNLFGNQSTLAKSHDRLDDQFCVLARLLFLKINAICAPTELRVPITYEEVNQTFLQFDEFKKRSDFREHFRSWYMGEDLSKLPPPPQPKEETKAGDQAPNQEFPAGAQIFGGESNGRTSESGNGASEVGTERQAEENVASNQMP